MFSVKPKHALGQNFLKDPNILPIITQLAGLKQPDTVLEIGGGTGVLSTYLAQRCAHLHVIELDRDLEPVLRDELTPYQNTDLVIADALAVDFAELTPPPNKLIANLPYGVAATVILKSIAELPALTQWLVMVQREVGERFAAKAGSKIYGIPSVLAQLATDVHVARKLSRNIFHPVPHVDSVLLSLRRKAEAPSNTVVEFVQAVFAHRRKGLVKSATLALNLAPQQQAALRETLLELKLPENTRAEQLTPDQLSTLAATLSSAQ